MTPADVRAAEQAYAAYRGHAHRRPVNAARHLRSLEDSLRGDGTDHVRLTEAARGLADGLAAQDRCRDCGKTLTTKASRLKGIGPDCERKREAAS